MLLLLFTLTFVYHIGIVQLESPSVIIIGAGPAGIAAASKLLENSIDNITILEAENRIGGRVNTVKFGDSLIELGAEYCHGEKGNTVYELTKDLDLLDRRVNMSKEIIVLSNGSRLSYELKVKLEGVIFGLDDVHGSNNTGESLQDHFTHRYFETILSKNKDKEKLEFLESVPRFAEGTLLSFEGAFSWSDVSAKSYYEQCEGHQELIWKGVGYKTIFEILTKKYPDPSQELPIHTKIQLNSEVNKIFWGQNGNVNVLTSKNKTYSADYVIFTPSLGVLKQQKGTMFTPPLPLSKRKAINAIGFGGVIKIFVHFPTKWWKDDEDYSFAFLWKKDDLHNISFTDGPSKDGVSWVSQIRSVTRELYTSNVWVFWVTGDLVPEIENLPPETLKKGSQYVLNRFLGGSYNLTEADAIVSSKWCSNKHFLGTYSYLKVGSYKEGVSYYGRLAEPLAGIEGKQVVLFAGESTHPVHQSTVHGAIETGFREAQRIIKLHEKQNKA